MSEPSQERKQPLILVVDDTAMICEMARESLQAAGLDVATAADGGPGLRIFEQQAPDLVLLDVQMPGLDGFSVCEQIRQRLGDTDTPVVMMTGANDEDSIRRAYDSGATDFVTKPVNWQILTQRIRYMLRMSQVLVDLRRNRERLANAQRIARLGDWEYDLAANQLVCSDELRRHAIARYPHADISCRGFRR